MIQFEIDCYYRSKNFNESWMYYQIIENHPYIRIKIIKDNDCDGNRYNCNSIIRLSGDQSLSILGNCTEKLKESELLAVML